MPDEDKSLLAAGEQQTPEQLATAEIEADAAALAAAKTPEEKAVVGKTIVERRSQTPEAKKDAADLAAAKTPEEKALVEKSIADRKAANSVPEKYAFKLPEGQKLDDKLVESVTPIFRELKLTQTQADKLVAFHTAQTQAQTKAYEVQIEAWRKEITSDPKSAELLGDAKRAVEKFADSSMKALLEDQYFGNHPLLVKFLAGIGRSLKEDKVVEGVASGRGAGERKPDAEVVYPNSK